MTIPKEINEIIQKIVGIRLDDINLACEMMMFGFGKYELHSQCLTRIIKNNDILVTTQDYQNWDEKVDTNNDEWHFVNKFKGDIIGGTVLTLELSSLGDIKILLDNGIRIELYISNGRSHHYGEENEQWVFFKLNDFSHPFVSVYQGSVGIREYVE